jgi:hypothetical protein
MNRQEAIAELKRMASTIEWDYPLAAQIAIEKAVEALSGPTPDPDTGLVPCGCGCKPELRYDGWYQVYCTGCDMHGGNSHTPDGVIEEWNTAMGYTAPSRPDAGEMAPNGDEGAES